MMMDSNWIEHDPLSIEEALERIDSKEWKEAMQEEYKSLLQNETWELVERPTDRKVIDSK